MARRLPRRQPMFDTSLCRTVYGEEVEFNISVDFTFEPGEREIRYGDNACPGSDPYVGIDDVVVTKTGERIDLTPDEEATIKEAIIEEMESRGEPDEDYGRDR